MGHKNPHLHCDTRCPVHGYAIHVIMGRTDAPETVPAAVNETEPSHIHGLPFLSGEDRYTFPGRKIRLGVP